MIEYLLVLIVVEVLDVSMICKYNAVHAHIFFCQFNRQNQMHLEQSRQERRRRQAEEKEEEGSVRC